MNIFDALKKLGEGYKIRESDWNQGTYLYLDGTHIMSHSATFSSDQPYSAIGTCLKHDQCKWEVYDDTVRMDNVERGCQFQYDNGRYTRVRESFHDGGYVYATDSAFNLFKFPKDARVIPFK